MKLLLVFTLLLTLISGRVSAQAEEKVVEQQEINTALNSLITNVDEHYLYTEKRDQIVEHLTLALKSGEFDGHFPFGRLKRKLETTLMSVSDDTRFEIRWRSGISDPTSGADEFHPGAVHTQLLQGNIGYIAIEGDLITENWHREIDGALAAMASAKALIVDLRASGLSSLSLCQQFLSYFIPSGQPLAELKFGRADTVVMKSEKPANPKFQDRPVYIVTSPFVAGGWEFVAYTLKHAERATLIGTPTMGIGSLTTTVALSQHLKLVMAYAELRDPETGENWQDWGVLPDVESDSHDALEVAIELVNQQLTNAMNGN